MVFRIYILFIALLGNLYLAPFAGAETHPKAECPFSYKLPGEIKSFLEIQSGKKQRAQLVEWRVECRLDSLLVSLSSFCQIETTIPHRRICQKTSRWNNKDTISISTPLSGTGTEVRYLAIAPNDFFLSVRAKVKSDKNGPLVEEALQTVIKLALSVRMDIRGSTPTVPDLTTAVRGVEKISTMNAPYKDTDCPFAFSLPKDLVLKTKRLPNLVYYSSRTSHTPLARLSLGCGSNRQSHYLYLLKAIRCIVEPAPPHRRICIPSKRWNGIEKLQIVTVGETSMIQYLVYTPQDHWLFMEVSFDKSADKADIENSLAIVQTMVQNMRYAPASKNR